MYDQIDDVGGLAARYDAVVRRIAREHRVSRGVASRWFEDAIRFLDMCHASPGALSPSRTVDKAWHEFLLFTRDYQQFCEERYGRFIHHQPYDDEPRHQSPVPWWWRLRLRGDSDGASDGDASASCGSSCGGGGCGGGGS